MKTGTFVGARQSWERALDSKDQLADRGARAYVNLGASLAVQGTRHIRAGAFEKAEETALGFVRLKRRAAADGMEQVMDQALESAKGKLAHEELSSLDEFQVMLAVVGEEDPVERWKTLGQEISKRWPKEVSAAKAIREERR